MSRHMISVIFVFSLGITQQAFALLELNVGYHGLVTNSSGGNWTVPGMSMSGAYGLQMDARFEIPVTGIGLGIRYGKLGLDTSGTGGQSISMLNESTAALFAYRFINTGMLLGAVFTYGLSNTGSLKNSLATPNTTRSAGSVTHYTAGLEIGLKIPILLAVEFGYGSLQMSGFGSTLSGSATSVDITGPYMRGSAGFSF